MPAYDYKCTHCESVVTLYRPMSERQLEVECPECGNKMKYMFGVPGIKWNTTGRTVKATPKG